MKSIQPLRYRFLASTEGLLRSIDNQGHWRLEREAEVNGVKFTPGMYYSLGPPERDLLRVASAVAAVDRLSPRCTSDEKALTRELRWSRILEVSIAVEDPHRWTMASQALESLLHFMTDDRWIVAFSPINGTTLTQRPLFSEAVPAESEIALFSGGLDSVAGMLARHKESARPFIAVSSWGNPVRGAAQVDALQRLQREEVNLRWVRVSSQVITLSELQHPHELSQRARGFLFLSLGAVIASTLHAQRFFTYESGVGAINLPLGECQVGSQVTRAMHPGTLLRMEELLNQVLVPLWIESPFMLLTKGEVCDLLGDRLPVIAEVTMSCDEGEGHKPDKFEHCGLCTSCLFRRIALHHSLGRSDPTHYRDIPSRRHSTYDLTMLESHGLRLSEASLTFDNLLQIDPEIRWAKHYLTRHGDQPGDFLPRLCSLFARYAADVGSFLSQHRPVLTGRTFHPNRLEADRDLFTSAR